MLGNEDLGGLGFRGLTILGVGGVGFGGLGLRV